MIVKVILYIFVSMVMVTVDGPTATPSAIQLNPTRTMRPTMEPSSTPWPYTQTPYPGPVEEDVTPYPGVLSAPSAAGVVQVIGRSPGGAIVGLVVVFWLVVGLVLVRLRGSKKER